MSVTIRTRTSYRTVSLDPYAHRFLSLFLLLFFHSVLSFLHFPPPYGILNPTSTKRSCTGSKAISIGTDWHEAAHGIPAYMGRKTEVSYVRSVCPLEEFAIILRDEGE